MPDTAATHAPNRSLFLVLVGALPASGLALAAGGACLAIHGGSLEVVVSAGDNATSGVLDEWMGLAEERAWFLFESIRDA